MNRTDQLTGCTLREMRIDFQDALQIIVKFLVIAIISDRVAS